MYAKLKVHLGALYPRPRLQNYSKAHWSLIPMLVTGFFSGYLHHPTLQAVLAMTLLSEQVAQKSN